MVNFLKKEFLLGVGVGFIISAILTPLFGPGELTNDQIKARAAKLGMIERQDTPAVPVQGANTASGQGQKQITKSETVAQKSPNGVMENRSKDQANGEAKDQDQSQEQDQEREQEPRLVSITVTSGMGSEEIADLLKDKGAIQSRQEFLQAVTDLKAHTRIQNGTFQIPVGEQPEKIVRMLIERP